MLRSSCGVAAETKGENIRNMKWRPADRRAGGRAKRIKKKEVKQEDASNNGTEFRLREQGVGDKCGLVPKSVRRGEEIVDGKVRWFVRREENIRDIVCGYEIRNITLLVRLIRRIRKCHRPKYFPRRGGRGGRGSPRGCVRERRCYIRNRCIVGNRV